MGRTAKVGQAGSFGPRYGTVTRKRYAEIIRRLRTSDECPRCHVIAVRRESVGIWYCKKCGYRFAGGAYAAHTKLGEVARRATKEGTTKGAAAELGLVGRSTEIQEKAAKPTKKRAPRREKAAEDVKEESE